MPFGAIERPSIGLGLLGAELHRRGVACDTRYLNLAFAEAIGSDDYLWLSNDVPYTAFAGEWVFRSALYGHDPDDDNEYIEAVLRSHWGIPVADIGRLLRIREQVEPFLERQLSSVNWDAYRLVGFTSIFHQNLPSLALARRVKEAYPSVAICFGGANWEGEMGLALMEVFPFVDYACSGKADESFPALVEALDHPQPDPKTLDLIPGLYLRDSEGRPGSSSAPARSMEDLDALPYPDFDPYVAQRAGAPSLAHVPTTMLIETARGCWWGQRSHCTFCGLNGSTMAFRSKDPDRAYDEIAYLLDRYATTTFSVVDDILDMRYFRSLLLRLAEASVVPDFFWEVKANLTHDQVRILHRAGISHIQPGIESLSDRVLELMGKGTTALRNIQLLKWCREFGVLPQWNLLFGFPGEMAEDYEATEKLIRAIWHLDPPTGWGPIRLDRFSPYHADPAGYGMQAVRPMKALQHLYPVPAELADRIAYYFDFDYEDGRDPWSYTAGTIELVQAWMADHQRGDLWIRRQDDDDLLLIDSRRGVASSGGLPAVVRLKGWKAAVYLYCDYGRTLTEIESLPAVSSAGLSRRELGDFIKRCLNHQFMVASGGRYLGVGVHSPARSDDASTRPRRLLTLLNS